MGRIQSSIGLITGTPIADTVDQLIELSAKPRDRLEKRVEGLEKERVAVTELTALVIGTQLAGNALGEPKLFQAVSAASSNSDALSVKKTGDAEPGSYHVDTIRRAQTQSFASAARQRDLPLGEAGVLTIRGGGFVDASARLEDLNGGRGAARGQIRITDRAGRSAVVDLRDAETIDDVLQAINEQADVEVEATTDGDRLRLHDHSGGAGNLRVQEVGGGRTAADLGLAGINAAADSISGADVYRLAESTRLGDLNDGLGVALADGEDLQVEFRDGTSMAVDFGDFSREASPSRATTDAASEDARVTISAVESGGANDGIRVRFVDDPGVVQGDETVELIDTGQGREMVFRIEAGQTTADDIVAALSRDSELSGAFTATAGGSGAGAVGVEDEATFSGGAALSAVNRPSLGDVLRVLNEADPERLQARLSTTGDGIELVDLTTGGGTFSVADAEGSTAASDLGLDGEAAAETLTGRTLQSGLRGVRLDNLGGGAGLGPLGALEIRTADGQTDSIDLGAAETLQDVINAINSSDLGVSAGYNASRTGLAVRDLSGGSAATFDISSADETAARLGLETSTADSLIDGGDLGLQFVSRATSLDSLNQGRGVGNGSFTVTDSLGQSSGVNLRQLEAETVGDVVAAINGLGLKLEAKINDTGDGIVLVDTGGGPITMSVLDSGSGSAAAELGIAGTGVQRVVDGEVRQMIEGVQADRIVVDADDTLETLAEKIRTESRFARASVVNTEGGAARLALTSARGGEAGRITASGLESVLGLSETARGQDAMIAVGDAAAGTATLLRSADGVFDDAIAGVSLTLKELADGPVEIKIEDDPEAAEKAVGRFVDQYNKLFEKLESLTFYDPETDSSGLLAGSTEALRIESGFGRLLSGRVNGAGSLSSLESVGLSLDDEGRLSLDETRLRAALTESKEAVSDLFTTEETGLAARLEALTDRLAGEGDSLLLGRSVSLNRRIEQNNARIESMDQRLESERERLLKQFYSMEMAVSKMQSNIDAISKIQPVQFDNSGD